MTLIYQQGGLIAKHFTLFQNQEMYLNKFEVAFMIIRYESFSSIDQHMRNTKSKDMSHRM